MIFVEHVESSVYLGITPVSPPSFLLSDSAPSLRIAALTVIIWQSHPCLPEIVPELTGEQGCTNFAFIHFQTLHHGTCNGKLLTGVI